MSFEAIQSPIDRDRKLKIMEELIKTNQKHIEHLKQTIVQLKKVTMNLSKAISF